MVSLYVDSKDRLWIGTNDNGVAMMEKGKITRYENEDYLKSYSIRSFVEDPKGNIYIATTHGMGMVDTDLKLHAVNESQINDEYICELRASLSGVIYGETMNGAVFTMEDGKVTGFYDGNKLGIGVITTVLPDPKKDGYVYLGTEGSEIIHGKLENGLTDRTTLSIGALSYVNSIEHFKDQIWVCTKDGVGFFENDKFVRLGNIPMNNSIGHMLTDYQGNLWFTSNRQGVMKIVPNQFTDLYEWYGLDSAVVNATCRMGNELFIGTDTGATIIGENTVKGTYPLKSVKGAPTEKKDVKDLLKLLDPDFSFLARPYIFDNKAFPKEWSEGKIAGRCAIDCTHCGKCTEVLKLVYKRDPDLPDYSKYSMPKPKPFTMPDC